VHTKSPLIIGRVVPGLPGSPQCGAGGAGASGSARWACRGRFRTSGAGLALERPYPARYRPGHAVSVRAACLRRARRAVARATAVLDRHALGPGPPGGVHQTAMPIRGTWSRESRARTPPCWPGYACLAAPAASRRWSPSASWAS